ncbi:hypothetical protein BGI32_05760 [Snodgrassella alvi]|uniref:YspA cpYpsA-related SLOG domain-containing protein n=1 Tax=Snodgrassella alvi TaxID=1196083 RepID=A0A2N9WU19_9NEIS|nr:SLOG family protein [Snodgrassella alvi]PIT15434.1 hypothetical protein BGI32_05760 [Snodgrassella alvi]
MNVIVCGGRIVSGDGFRRIVARTLLSIHTSTPIDTLIDSGTSHGAVYLAREWARVHNIQTKSFTALLGRHGNNCGHMRNQKMIDYALHHNAPKDGQNHAMLVVFKDKYGRGTKDIIKQAKEASIFVWTVDLENEAS